MRGTVVGICPHSTWIKWLECSCTEPVVMKVAVYESLIDDTPIGDYTINEGDVTILLAGGHSLMLEEDSIFYEFKTGPYEGQEKDKIWIQ